MAAETTNSTCSVVHFHRAVKTTNDNNCKSVLQQTQLNSSQLRNSHLQNFHCFRTFQGSGHFQWSETSAQLRPWHVINMTERTTREWTFQAKSVKAAALINQACCIHCNHKSRGLAKSLQTKNARCRTWNNPTPKKPHLIPQPLLLAASPLPSKAIRLGMMILYW